MRRNTAFDMEKIFVMNLGTTSFKFKLYGYAGEEAQVLASGEAECVGAETSRYVLLLPEGGEIQGERHLPSHGAAFETCIELLREKGVLVSFADLTAVAYKAVHGGRLSGTRIVDDDLLAEMERVLPLAPAHNAIYLSAMQSIRARFPDLIQAVRFETSFHATVPEKRAVYGVPYQWKEELGIRRYGFHGSSHQYIAETMKKLAPSARRVVSCHLGGSSSVCGILDGKSVAVSMGATPQSGLFQNNRAGDFDPFCLPFIMERYGYTLEEVLKILSSSSGFLGLSGVSNDYRLVEEAAEGGNARARLALDAFADQIKGLIGQYAAYLGGLDALVFTGGIGFGAAELRSRVCEELAFLGVALDEKKNASGAERISSDASSVSVWRLKTDEESVVARCVRDLLRKGV